MSRHLHVLQLLLFLSRANAQCAEGFTGPDGGPCTACVAGSYKTTTGTTACTWCGNAKYSTAVGSTSSATCLTCPADSGDSCPICPAITNCACNKGYTGPSGGICTACTAGQYKITNGAAPCTNCGTGKYSATVGATVDTTCLACPANSGSTCITCVESTSCICNIGASGPNGGPCTVCVAGKYKTTTGTAVCTDCEAGKYSTTAGAATCIDCEAGKYSTTVGANVAATCINCGVSSYSTVVDTTTCLTCPANSGASCTTCYTPHCPCNAGYVGGNFISQYSTNGCSRFHALMTWKPSFASVSTRNNAAIGTLPTYNALGGPSGKGHVNFNSAQAQWLSTGSRTFNIGTNGGFTIVIVMRWAGVLQTGQHILTSGNPRTWEIYRYGATTIEFLWWNGNTWWRVWRSTTMTQDVTWLTIVVRYNKNGQVYSTINGAGGTDGRFGYGDRTFDALYLGRSRTNTGHLNGDIAGAFIVDELLTIDATNVISNAMVNGMDLTDTTCPSGNTCTVCPMDSTSPTGSTQITSCTCNQGYTGLNGGPCTACPVGTYKQNSGSAACIDCVAGKYSILTARIACTDCAAGTYSPTVAATSVAVCLACPANANSPAGSTATTSCTCNVGFALSNNVCVCDLGYQPGA